MRYELNQQIFAIHFDYASKRNSDRGQFRAADFALPFRFGDKEVPSKINLERLVVKKHEKVGWDQDPEGKKEYDGYLLADSKGAIYANQYPTASYGQVTDTADRRFNYHVSDGVDHNEVYNMFDTGARQVYEYNELGDVIRNIYEGQNAMRAKLEKEGSNLSKEDLGFYNDMLRNLDTVWAMIRAAFDEKFPEWTYSVEDVNFFKDNPSREPAFYKKTVFRLK